MGYTNEQGASKRIDGNDVYPDVFGTNFAKMSNEYTLSAWGHITNPGKFERELWFVPALWDMVMEGMQDGDLHLAYPTAHFRLGEYEKVVLDLGAVDVILLWQDDSGFVNAEYITEHEFSEIVQMHEGGQ